jgi:hypothetical protein
MRIFSFIPLSAVVAGIVLAESILPASASPVLIPDNIGRSGLVAEESGPGIEKAQYRRGGREYRRGNREYRRGNREYRRGNRQYRRYARRDYRYDRRRNYRRYGPSYRYWGPGIGLGFFFGPGLYPPAPPPIYYTPVPQVGGACAYWLARCEANWSRPQDIRGCLRYQGCL